VDAWGSAEVLDVNHVTITASTFDLHCATHTSQIAVTLQ
jgi:hypothetical protein